MGERANYILKENNKLTIYYNHWRANCLQTDLYLGDKLFLDFVKDCQIDEEIMNWPWIEGCAIIDKDTKSLFFWSSDFPWDTSAVNYYLKKLSKKWEGWNISILKNEMYGVGKILSIDYIYKEEINLINKPSIEEIITDNVEEWVRVLVIIKQDTSLFVTKTGRLNTEKIFSYGQDIISLIKNKPKYDLPKEGKESASEIVLIDQGNKKIFIKGSNISLIETYKELWKDYQLIIGDFGYIEILNLSEIDTSALVLSEAEIKSQFEIMVKRNEGFKPFEMAEKILQEHANVQFNPDFFDNVKSRKTIFDRLKLSILKMFRL